MCQSQLGTIKPSVHEIKSQLVLESRRESCVPYTCDRFQLVSLFCDFVTHCNFVNVSAGTEVEKNKMGSQTSLISNTSEFSQRTLFGLW